jgi:ABC transporter substrate binding protein
VHDRQPEEEKTNGHARDSLTVRPTRDGLIDQMLAIEADRMVGLAQPLVGPCYPHLAFLPVLYAGHGDGHSGVAAASGDAVTRRARVSRHESRAAVRFFTAHLKRLVDLAGQSRLAAIYEHRDFPNAGGLMSYGPSIAEMYRQAATYVDKILKGAKPSDLPIEQPTKFELVINLKTAKALGLTIPPSLLQRADQVIE